MKMKQLLRIVIVGLALIISIAGTVCSVSAADVRIIANKNVPVSSITQDMLKDIFLGNKNTWDNGTRINFVVLNSGELHDDFLKTYIKKSPVQYTNFWKKQVFTGKGQMPKEINSDKAMPDYIASTDGAIGYVSGSTDTGSAKVIPVK